MSQAAAYYYINDKEHEYIPLDYLDINDQERIIEMTIKVFGKREHLTEKEICNTRAPVAGTIHTLINHCHCFVCDKCLFLPQFTVVKKDSITKLLNIRQMTYMVTNLPICTCVVNKTSITEISTIDLIKMRQKKWMLILCGYYSETSSFHELPLEIVWLITVVYCEVRSLWFKC